MMTVMLLARMVVGCSGPRPRSRPGARGRHLSRRLAGPPGPSGRAVQQGGGLGGAADPWLGRPPLGRLGRLPIRPRPGPRPGPRSGVGRQLPCWQLAGFRGAGQQRRRQRRRRGRHRRGVALLAGGGGRRWFGGAAAGLRSRARVVCGRGLRGSPFELP